MTPFLRFVILRLSSLGTSNFVGQGLAPAATMDYIL